ncbi:zwei Ig domain protein zig-8-like [Teleopsis dalmanni]|uniref:zwei Ig domain protein zig-8-like n=1 Tax=Teleopsis dalmanni TaxID=139649 RepID=UPI0018CEF4F2|nr:zwei Ig domain protein zig-8-like [Teleopsis dalmanni]
MELPTEVQHVLFDKLSTPELKSLRKTCKQMQKSVDDYIQHKCAVRIRKGDVYSTVFKSIYDVVNKVIDDESEKHAFMLNVVTINCGEFYFNDFQDVKHVLETLKCRLQDGKKVSWIRKRDLHILTAGSTTYTSDQRFQVLRPENSCNWTLQIKYPQPRDSGIYECQINTEPKMSLSYIFNVIELKANIIGPSDLYVKSGSDINLTCKIMQGPHELGNIFWYKGNDIIDMTTNQNEIDSGNRISLENDWSDGLTSRLKIRRAMPSDTGNYTCVPTIAKTSSVYVHVIIGEHPAAMQHNSSSMSRSNFYCSICCMLFTIFTCCLQHLFATATTVLTTAATRHPGSTLAATIATTQSLHATHAINEFTR